MIRLVSLIGLAFSAIAASPAAAQSGPALKPAVHIASAIVTIGDLVTNAGSRADLPVFRAPDLGETGSVPVEDIVDALAAHGLSAINTAGLRNVVVTRDSRAVLFDDLRSPLAQALAAHSDADPEALDIYLAGKAIAVHLPVEADGPVQIQKAAWNSESGAFNAVVTAGRVDGRTERHVITGTAIEAGTVLAIRRSLSRGAVLAEGDIEVRRVAKTEIDTGVLTDIASAAGLEVRRSLREGHVLRASDLAEPTLVKGSSTVTVILKSGGLTLTATGEALKDGKRGETISVMNAQSKRVLQAVVTNFNEVTIHPPRTIVSAAK